MFGRSKRMFTVMLIPHCERSVTTFRVPLIWLQVLAFGVVAVVLSALVFAHKYQQMTVYMDELRELRVVNRQQRAEVEYLAAQTQVLQAAMRRLDALDQQLRAMMKIEGAPSELALEAEDRVPLAAGPADDTTIASLGPVPPGGLTGRGGGGGFAPLTGGIVSLEALREAQLMRLNLSQLGQELLVREESLQALRDKVTQYLAFLEAKPAGWPTTGQITSGFGWRRSPYGGGRQFHEGIDIAAPPGTPVVATGAGTVVLAGWHGPYGYAVIVDHGFGFKTLYAHNQRLAVTVGTPVKRGQVIAYVGSSGRSTGPHLHYEVFVNGQQTNPWPYLEAPADALTSSR